MSSRKSIMLAAAALLLSLTCPARGERADTVAVAAPRDSIYGTRVEKEPLKAASVYARAEPVRVKDDTVIFNAAAFRVSEDADLSALLKKIPGIEVDASDNVTLNGKPVRKLLVNGKKYFGGDVKTGLRNISADMVGNIRAYEQESDFARMTGIDDGEQEPVLDLNIRKEFMERWNKRIRLGGGSSVGEGISHPDGLLYSLRANAGLISDSTQINIVADGYDTPSTASSKNVSRTLIGGGGNGLRDIGQIGVTVSRSAKKWDLDGMLQYNGSMKDNSDKNRSQSILPDKMTVDKSVTPYDTSWVSQMNWSNSTGSLIHEANSAKGELTFEWKPDKYNTFNFKPTFSFNFDNNLDRRNSMTFNSDPYGIVTDPCLHVADRSAGNPLSGARVNSSDNRGRSYKSTYSVSASALWVHRFQKKRGRSLSVRAAFSDYNWRGDDFHDYSTRYYTIKKNPDSTLVRKHYIDQDIRNIYFAPQVSWTEPVAKNWYFQAMYRYELRTATSRKDFYRFDELEEWTVDWQPHTGLKKVLGTLPGTLEDCLWDEFSAEGKFVHHSHVIQLNMRYGRKNLNFSFGAVLKPQNTVLTYPGAEGMTKIRQSLFNAAPTLTLKYTPKKSSHLTFTYYSSSSLPGMSRLLPVQSGTNPLYVSVGNPYIKPPFTHRAESSYNKSLVKKHLSINAALRFKAVENQVVNSTTYDHESGIRTTTPQNINGNWEAGGNLGISKIFKGNHFSITSQTAAEYRNDVSFLYNSRIKADERNKVTRFMARERLETCYRNNWAEITAKLGADFTDERSLLRPLMNQTPYSFSAGVEAVINMPWKMRAGAEFSWQAQRGWRYAEMNRDYHVLNAEISQTLFKGRCTLSLRGFDLLGSLDDIVCNFSSSSRSISFNEGINRYIMLNVSWKF